MNCNNNQNNNNGCGCNCNPHPIPAPEPVDINMSVCDRNINMLPMLQTYTTKVLKPNIEGCCKKNVLKQCMMNCENYKYVIKWDFDLNGETITVPENCILEFDGGSLKNGTIIGQDTVINNMGDLNNIFGENLLKEGTWRDHFAEGGSGGGLPDKDYDPEHFSGLGRKTLQLKDGSNVLTQEDFDSANTIYIIGYDFDLGGGNTRTLNFTASQLSSVRTTEKQTLDNATAEYNDDVNDYNAAVAAYDANPTEENRKEKEKWERIKNYAALYKNRVQAKFEAMGSQQYYSWVPVDMNAGDVLYLTGRAIRLNESKTETVDTDRGVIYADTNMTVYVGCLIGNYSFRYDKSIVIPNNCILSFEGGSISDGMLIGNNTRITAEKYTIFDSVVISGTWNVPEITSTWFKCEHDNDIIQPFNLLSGNIYNKIIIENRTEDYWVNCQEGSYKISEPTGILNIKSNTDCIIDGTIRQRGHATDYVHIIELFGVENVHIMGSGVIHGDKELHDYNDLKYDAISMTLSGWVDIDSNIIPSGFPAQNHNVYVTTHEGNHIINVNKCKNIIIEGLTFMDATGDGIDILNYELNMDNNIIVRNFYIENCRRQGISVEGNNIVIENGVIKSVGTIDGNVAAAAHQAGKNDCLLAQGTLPMAAIDSEISMAAPTRKARNITIKNLDVSYCHYGFLATTEQIIDDGEHCEYFHADMGDYRYEKCKIHNVGVGCYFDCTVDNISVTDCDITVTAIETTLTLMWLMANNTRFTNCVFNLDDGRTDKTYPIYNLDYTYLRTRYRFTEDKYTHEEIYADKVINKTVFQSCIFNLAEIELLKRANYGTEFNNCTITAGRFVTVDDAKGSVVDNCIFSVVNSTISPYSFTIKNSIINTVTSLYIGNTTLIDNIIKMDGDKVLVNGYPSGFQDKRAFFYINYNTQDVILGNQIIITGSDDVVKDPAQREHPEHDQPAVKYYITAEGLNHSYCRFANNIINNLDNSFALDIAPNMLWIIARNNYVGRSILLDAPYKDAWTATEIITEFPADSYYLDYANKKWGTSSSVGGQYCGHLIDVTEHRGEVCTFKGGVAMAVIKSAPADGEDVDYATGFDPGENKGYTDVYTFKVPNDASYIWVQVNGADTSGSRAPKRVHFCQWYRYQSF